MKELNYILSKPYPTLEENKVLLKKVLKDNSDENIWNIVLPNARLVAKIICKYCPNHPQKDELFNEGMIGFYVAVKRLNKKTTMRNFYIYCKKCVFGYIFKHLAKTKHFNSKISTFTDLIKSNDFNIDESDMFRNYIDEPSNQYTKYDTESMFDNLTLLMNNSRFKLSDNEKNMMKLLMEKDSQLDVARELKCTKQNVFIIKGNITRKVKNFLRVKPELCEKLFGKYSQTIKKELFKNDKKD